MTQLLNLILRTFIRSVVYTETRKLRRSTMLGAFAVACILFVIFKR